jgi:hypothetical protein
MLVIGLVLLALWFLGLFGMYSVGDLFHGFLLIGLMLLLLAFVQAREAALRPPVSDTKKGS